MWCVDRMRVMIAVVTICLGCVPPCTADDEFVTIRAIQYTEAPEGASPYNGQVVNCAGGVVFGKTGGSRPRLLIEDPNVRDGWAGIQVKGWAIDAFKDVNVGDWVRLERVFVEENGGMTFLQYGGSFPEGSLSALTIASRGQALPRPLVVDVNEIAAPQYVPADDAWIVPDHRAERFESMLLQVRNVMVVGQGMGKAQDNYGLQPFGDPNISCWASDYLNQDKPKSDLYLAAVVEGQRFRGVTGILEQYTNLGKGYDYYQFLTLSSASIVGLCTADLDQDGDVDLWDSRNLTEQLLGITPPATADLNGDGKVDATDLNLFNAAWQQADVNGDGIVDGNDLD